MKIGRKTDVYTDGHRKRYEQTYREGVGGNEGHEKPKMRLMKES